MEIDSMSAAIRCVIDGMPDGTCFFGNELKKKVVRVYPKARHAYVASVLHCMRRWSPLKKSAKWTNLQIPPESLEFEK